MEHLSTDKAALTVPEFCRLYSLSRPTAYRLMASGAIQYRDYGRRLILVESIKAWLDSLPGNHTPAAA